MGFSPAARLRMLKLIATIDWKKAGHCLFVTLTYPDDDIPMNNKATNSHRYLLHRWIEQHLGKDTCVLWRIEWQTRKTGKLVGCMCPHFHLVVFNVRYLPYKEINAEWARIIGARAYVRTEVKGMTNAQQTVYYVAKYCAKVEEVDCSLVNAAYLNSGGRSWGILRAGLLPRHKLKIARHKPTNVEDALKLARELRPQIANHEGSFTLIGNTAVEVAVFLAKKFP